LDLENSDDLNKIISRYESMLNSEAATKKSSNLQSSKGTVKGDKEKDKGREKEGRGVDGKNKGKSTN